MNPTIPIQEKANLTIDEAAAYLKNTVAEEAHLDFFGDLPEEKVILADGTDATDEVLKAEQWLIEHSF